MLDTIIKHTIACALFLIAAYCGVVACYATYLIYGGMATMAVLVAPALAITSAREILK